MTSFRPVRVRRPAEQACSRIGSERTDRACRLHPVGFLRPFAAVQAAKAMATAHGKSATHRRVSLPNLLPCPSQCARPASPLPSLRCACCGCLRQRQKSKIKATPVHRPADHRTERRGTDTEDRRRKERKGEVAPRVKRARCFCRALRACGRLAPLARRGHQANAARLATSLPLRTRGIEEGLHRTSNTRQTAWGIAAHACAALCLHSSCVFPLLTK
jgi:hypothetical protein